LVERLCKHLQLIIWQIVDNIGNQTPKHQVIVSKKSGALLIVPSTLTFFLTFFVQKLLDESNFDILLILQIVSYANTKIGAMSFAQLATLQTTILSTI
jgi:hypothetical protein